MSKSTRSALSKSAMTWKSVPTPPSTAPALAKPSIGEGTKIDNLVQIGHNCVIGKHCLIVALTGISGSTHLGNYVTCAGQVGIAGHVTIGDRSVLTARTGVTNNLAGGEVYCGRPAKPFREDMKLRVHVRRLPKLVERVKALEAALQVKPAPDA